MATPGADLARLREALSDGRLEQVRRSQGVSMCVLHGSAVITSEPGDMRDFLDTQRLREMQLQVYAEAEPN